MWVICALAVLILYKGVKYASKENSYIYISMNDIYILFITRLLDISMCAGYVYIYIYIYINIYLFRIMREKNQY